MAIMFAGAANAQSGLKTYKFTDAGDWRVSAMYNNGQFITCYANAKYKSGISVTLLVYSSGVWKLQFYKNSWPKRPDSRFQVTLLVDGRVVVSGSVGNNTGRSFFITLGRSANNIRALMNGNQMTVRTGSGDSRFRLTGMNLSAPEVARCWKHHQNRSNNYNNDNNDFNNNRGNNNNNDNAFRPRTNRNNDDAFSGLQPLN